MRAFVLCRRAADVALVQAAAALGETAAIAVGPEAELRSVLTAAGAAGATRLVRVWDTTMQGLDYLGVAYAIAATIRAIRAARSFSISPAWI